MSEIYAARGYGSRKQGFGAKPGLVVVDFQRGFTDPAFPMAGAPMVDAAVRNTVPLIEAARRAGLPVVACVNGYFSARAAPHWKADPVYDLLAGTPSVELDPRIAAAGPDVVLMKSAPSIFFATPGRLDPDEGTRGHGDRDRLHHLGLRAGERDRRLLPRLPRHGAGRLRGRP